LIWRLFVLVWFHPGREQRRAGVNMTRSLILALAMTTAVTLFTGQAVAERQLASLEMEAEDIPCCDSKLVQAIVWYGSDSLMTLENLAAYCGPVLWFSPDEPLLGDAKGKDIRLPEPFPFEDDPEGPVVYYRVRNLVVAGDEETAYVPDPADRGKSVIDLSNVVGVDLDFFFYYHAEAGFGGHAHDVESVEFKVFIWRREKCVDCPYSLGVTRAVGKAHGVLWYDNTLSMDEFTKFPLHILVEEGKHASCTDKNADGYFTPGYDVNRRVNDAWGVRDVLRSGALFTGNYEAWMTKVRTPGYRVFPPLPPDSPLRELHSGNGRYAPNQAVYELRPLPSAEEAQPDLVPFIADKGDPDWPDMEQATSLANLVEWSNAETFVKSVSLSLMADGDLGIAVVLPFFILKTLEDPVAGGYLCHRVYFKDKKLRDIGYMLHYTPSASRWVDGYVSAGWEWDQYDVQSDGRWSTSTRSDFVLETGIRFRANLRHSPFGFLSFLTDFWGIRAGLKNYGFFDIDRLTYVLEIGSGTW
jgi:hypothetical protein